MIPRIWTDSSSPDNTYSTEAPVVERLLRHSSLRSGRRLVLVWFGCFQLAIGAIYVLPSLPAMMLDGALMIGWGTTLMAIFGATYLGAAISGTQIRGQNYQLLWMTGLSDHALGSSLLVATLYRIRLGIAMIGGMMPLMVYGMTVGNSLWAVEISSCPLTWETAWCQEQGPPTQDWLVSSVVGFSLWLSLVALLPVGAMLGVWLGMRWRQPSIAGFTAVGIMSILLLMVGTLGLWAVESTPPLRESLVWGAELALFSGLMLILLTAVVFWRDGLIDDEGIETLLLVLGAIVALGWGLGFLMAHPITRGPLVNLFGVLAIPYGLLVVGLHIFWRGARTQVDG